MDIIIAGILIVLAALFVIVVAMCVPNNNGVHFCGICAVILIVIIFFVMLRNDAEFMIRMVLDYLFSLLSFGSLVLIVITILCCCGIVAANAPGGNQVAIRA